LKKKEFDGLARRIKVPLVLRRGASVPESDLRALASAGAAQIDFEGELSIVYARAVKKALSENGGPEVLGAVGKEAVKKRVIEIIGILGSAGRESAPYGRGDPPAEAAGHGGA
jgi:fructose/tagatose bisphosphate aldolase